MLIASVADVLVAIAHEAISQGSPLFLVVFVLTSILLVGAARTDEQRARRRLVALMLGLHLVLLPPTGWAATVGAAVAKELRLTGAVLGALSVVGMLGLVTFGVVLPRLRVMVPRIVQDVIVGAAGLIAVFGAASRAGVNLSGIVATGAVVTAVIGLALQDTLGNLVGGLALQLDSTIQVGDWIRVQDVTGRVREIRWRSTSIETRNWETVVIPNSVLTRANVTVLGRRSGETPRWRRWIYFQVDYRYTPTTVIDTVLGAIKGRPIANVASEPEPSCVLMDFTDSSARYAVRYFLNDIAIDDPTDSVVRTRIYFALTRAGIPLAIPAHTVFMTEDSVERRQRKQEVDLSRRVKALSRIELFGDLSQVEREQLAQALTHAPFTAGEVLTREGSEAHHLYVIDRGQCSVRVGPAGRDREVAQLHDGDFFGEMSLLTGEKRSATIIALTDTVCYRLDAEAFKRVLEKRPHLTEQLARQLAQRRAELNQRREEAGAAPLPAVTDSTDLIKRIRTFFGL